MTVADIQAALHREPFEPFSIRLTDGRSLPVPHPNFVAIHPTRIIVIADDGSWSVVEPPIVAHLNYGI